MGGSLMKSGDVARRSVPKTMVIAPPRHGGTVTVRRLMKAVIF